MDTETAGAFEAVRKKALEGGSADWRLLAEAYLGSGHYLEAEQCFRQVVHLDATDIQAEYGRGFCLERMGQTSAAIEVFKNTAARADQQLRSTCLYQIGRCYLREENSEEAEATFRQIREQSPAAYQLAKLLIRSDRAAEAWPILEEQIVAQPNSLKLTQLQMRAAQQLGNAQLAEELRDQEDRSEYKLNLEYSQSFISLFASRYGLSRILSKAMQLKQEGSLSQRLSMLDRALNIVRKNELWQYRSVYIALAYVNLGLGNTDRAAQLIAEIRAHTHDDVDLRDLEALVCAANGDEESAYRIWLAAAELNPSAFLYQRLADTNHQIPNELRQSYQGQQAFHEGIDALRNNQPAVSQNLLEGAAKLLPENERIWFYLGEAFRVQNNSEKAMAAFTECLRINPEHWRAKRQLQRLIEVSPDKDPDQPVTFDQG